MTRRRVDPPGDAVHDGEREPDLGSEGPLPLLPERSHDEPLDRQPRLRDRSSPRRPAPTWSCSGPTSRIRSRNSAGLPPKEGDKKDKDEDRRRRTRRPARTRRRTRTRRTTRTKKTGAGRDQLRRPRGSVRRGAGGGGPLLRSRRHGEEALLLSYPMQGLLEEDEPGKRRAATEGDPDVLRLREEGSQALHAGDLRLRPSDGLARSSRSRRRAARSTSSTPARLRGTISPTRRSSSTTS